MLRALELADYRRLRSHRRGWLARRLGLSVDEEEACLQVLTGTGQIQNKKGKWVLREIQAIDTRRDRRASSRCKERGGRQFAAVLAARLRACPLWPAEPTAWRSG